jgi:hydrogenase nickel incorporation protein HypA/HybF
VHELGLLTGVVKAVERTMADKGASGVEAVELRVGSLSGAELDALEAAWPLAVMGSQVKGAKLRIEWVQAAVYCPQCQAEREIDEFFALVCPQCGTPTGQLARGREFEVAAAWLDFGASPGAPA